VLLKLFEAYGVDWRDIAEDDDAAQLADIRAALQDPLFENTRPDLPQLRAAMAHSPDLAAAFVHLHRAYLAATDQLMDLANTGEASQLLPHAPEAVVHNFFRRNQNHFPRLETAAEAFWDGENVATDDQYFALKARLRQTLNLRVRVVPVAEMPQSLREYDSERNEVRLSEALDHPNRVFQLVHVAGLLEQSALFDEILAEGAIEDPSGQARCRVELANYFSAAVLMPYGPYLAEAQRSKYDFDHLATRFGVSFEQACHRATTLQRSGARGVPFFFMRVDKAGNVTKRFNATEFHLAEYGGACPRLDVHTAFRTPGRIIPQLVEMPDRSQFFVFARTVDRPSVTRHAQDVRLAVAMGCARDHAESVGYAETLNLAAPRPTEIGINCRICPRANCDQRAHQAVVLSAPVDTSRRGATRYAT
jgi:predicted transcriptional regulator